jgi:predicted metal-dependent hydrolase
VSSFFINSVRHYRDRITDPKLKQEMKDFYSQEAVHLREHQRYNELLCAQRGYDLEELEKPPAQAHGLG